LGRADYKWMLANVARQWTTPGRLSRFAFLSLGVQTQYNYEGDRTDLDFHSGLNATLKNYWNTGVFAIVRPSYLNERLTRGGPTVKNYGYNFLGMNLSGDQRKSLVWGMNVNLSKGRDNDEGQRYALFPSLTIKPTTSVNINIAPGWDHDWTAQQFVSPVSSATAPAGFDGTRYVFGRLEQRTFSVDTRVNATFTPNLTLELFAQPFLSSGHYTSFKEFQKPKSGDMTIFGRDNGSTVQTNKNVDGSTISYTIDPDGNGVAAPFMVDNPDFNFRSLRGTAVVRWEYRPGSTLFLVWTQQREGFDDFGDFQFGRDRSALFRDRPTNIFQVKATYWLGR
ncbi:MAG: DUF5916 domain-containing protein, partial [Gemmatimonadales bacterium]